MKKKIRNPLIRRIFREIIGEWRKYLVVAAFLILVIGYVSGMFVANESMMQTLDESAEKYNLEYGHFELDAEADEEALSAIATGTKADIHQYYLDEAKSELDEKFDEEFKKEFDPKFKEEFDSEFNSTFKSEFDKEFDVQFEKEFKSQFKSEFDKSFKSQFDKEFNTVFTTEFDKEFERQVYGSLIEQGLDEDTAADMLSDAVSAAKSDGTYDTTYSSAYNEYKSQNYSSSYNKAYKTAYNRAYPSAYKKAYSSAYPSAYKEAYAEAYEEAYTEAYDEAYAEAYKEAYDEAWAEIKEEVEEEYAKVIDKYELSDTDAPAVPVTLYENFFVNADEVFEGNTSNANDSDESDKTIRVYKQTDYINQACLMDGDFPASEDEIAIDRMHASNNGIEIGDEITVDGITYTVSGLIAYVNYRTLHENNNDSMFDALNFDVAMVTEEGFGRLEDAGETVHYSYAWDYDAPLADDAEEKTLSDYFLKALITQVAVADLEIEDYIPRYANSAVNFAPEDMGSDMAMVGVALYIFTIIIAFIFAITINNTIQKEASTIGTLRASGYTKLELLRSYIAAPIIVTLISAVVGNILGYTLLKDVVAGMYYNSYSLPTYETMWSSDAFIRTTLIPIVIMIVVNLVMVAYRLQLSPLKFLRHDLKKFRQKKAIRLPNLRFFGRFRLRIILQNLPNYLTLFVGIFFVAVMLAMAVGMTSTLANYQSNADEVMFANYQYVLTDYEDEDGDAIETSSTDAEKFDMTSLMHSTEVHDEETSVYGISVNSSYIQIVDFDELDEGEVYVSSSFAEKFGYEVGDEFTLANQYENESYAFTVAGIYDKTISIAIFMPIDHYQNVFELKEGEFTGYMSNEEITDIDEKYIATVLDEESITKIFRQLDHSIGSYMSYLQVLCVLLSAVLIYLLTKLIIEKNETSISMIKILGYTDREIFRLFILSTTIVFIIADALSVYLGVKTMAFAWIFVLEDMTGWIPFTVTVMDYIKMFGYMLAGYLIVVIIDFRRIRKIPMEQALKNID